jgi:hypothetical protein
VSANAGQITVSGTATPAGLHAAQVEVYTVSPDPSGFGEGKIYLGTANVDNAGHWTLSFPGAEPGCYTAFQGIKNWGGIVTSSEFGPSSCQVFLYLPVVVN